MDHTLFQSKSISAFHQILVLFTFEWGFECLVRKLYLHTAVSFISCLVFVGVWMSVLLVLWPDMDFQYCQRKLVNLKISSVVTCCQKN